MLSKNEEAVLVAALQGATRPARQWCAADAGYRDCSCPSAEQETWFTYSAGQPLFAQVLPNTSVEARPNGKPPGPGHGYGVHFPWPGPGVLPSAPPHLER